MDPEHHHVKPALVGLAGIPARPLQKGDRRQIEPVGRQHGRNPDQRQQQQAQPGAHRAQIGAARRGLTGTGQFVGHAGATLETARHRRPEASESIVMHTSPPDFTKRQVR